MAKFLLAFEADSPHPLPFPIFLPKRVSLISRHFLRTDRGRKGKGKLISALVLERCSMSLIYKFNSGGCPVLKLPLLRAAAAGQGWGQVLTAPNPGEHSLCSYLESTCLSAQTSLTCHRVLRNIHYSLGLGQASSRQGPKVTSRGCALEAPSDGDLRQSYQPLQNGGGWG